MSLYQLGRRNQGLGWVLAGGLIALVGGVLGGGCGGIDTSTLSGFCQAAAQIDCSQAVVQACYGSTDASLGADTNTCIASRSLPANCNPSGLPFHSEFASACLSEHQNAYSGASYDAMEAQALRAACLPAFNKGGEQGAQCGDDSDCDVGNQLACVMREGGNGTCQVPVQVMGGDKCLDPDSQCVDGDYCDQTNHCVTDGAAGDTCGAGQPCGTSYRCNLASTKCEAQYPDQHLCNVDSDCLNGFCLPVGTAAGGAGKCSASYIFAFNTATCVPFTTSL